MSDGTKIEWCDATVNAVNGCSVVSPGCTNCYAMKLAGTRLRNHPSRVGLTIQTKAGPVWNGEVRLNESALEQPLRWKRPRDIFWNAHGDMFHPKVPNAWRDRVISVCAATPQHRHQILTKRPDIMRDYFQGLPGRIRDWSCDSGLDFVDLPLPNVWLGTSVEDQARADERRDFLRDTPAAVRFVSYEPALEVVDWTGWEFLDWLISGGESGNNARYVDYVAYRTARDWCADADVAYFHKQNGVFDESGRKIGKASAGRLLDGVEHSGMPA
jgi:protein gp37